MGRAARPVAIAVHADSAFSNVYRDIMVPRPNRRVATLGFRVAPGPEAEGIAAAIDAVRDRYRG